MQLCHADVHKARANFKFIRMEKQSKCVITVCVRVMLAESLVCTLSVCSDRGLVLTTDSQTM